MANAIHEHRFSGPGGLGVCALVYDDVPARGQFDVLEMRVTGRTARRVEVTVIDAANGRRARSKARSADGDIDLRALNLHFVTRTSKHQVDYLWFPDGVRLEINWAR